MTQVTYTEAKAHLLELINTALNGDKVLITKDAQHAVQLVPVSTQPAQRQFGSAKGLITIMDDFDAPLADFDEYTK